MKFKLPSLQAAVSNSKNLTKDDIRQYIFVWNGVAMTFMSPVFMVDIYEYVKQECKIEDGEELHQLEQIVNFLHNKSIPTSAWKELTSPCDVDFDEDNEALYINKVGHKLEVILDNNNIGIQYFKFNIVKYLNILKANTRPIDGLAFEGPIMKMMGEMFKTESKQDTIRLFLCDNSSAVKFQLSRKSYIYGIVNMDAETSQLNKDLTSKANIEELIFTIEEGLSEIEYIEPKTEEPEEGEFSMDDDEDFELS